MLRWGVIRALARRLWPHKDNARVPVRRDYSPESEQWVPIAVEAPAPLLEMYRDVLGQNGIPAMVRSEGAGRGAMGGAPTMAGLLVPANCVQAACDLLNLDGSDLDLDDRERGMIGERTQGSGER